MGIKHAFTSTKTDQSDSTKVRPSQWNNDHTIDGDVDFGGHSLTNVDDVNASDVVTIDLSATTVVANEVTVADEAYNQSAWDGDLSVPTKNAVRDKIEALILSGGGVTDFLALDDTPDSYANVSAGPGPYPRVNTAETALEFKYSTTEYIDIRDYGTVVDGGDITAAWMAALADYGVGHANRRIRIPMVGSGTYTLDGAALTAMYRFPGGTKQGAWIFELDFMTLNLTTPLALSSHHTWRGMRTYPLNTFITGTMPAPGMVLANGIDAPTFSTYDGTAPSACTNWRIDNLHFVGNDTNGIALQVLGGSLGYVTDCWCDTEGPDAPLVVDTIFWVDFVRLYCQPRAASDLPAIRFTTEQAPPNLACGLIRIKDLKTTRNGILFENVEPTAGPVANIEIYDYISESQANGTSLLYFDSTSGLGVSQIRIIRPEIADPLVGTAYLIKNTGANPRSTSNIHIEGSTVGGTNLYDPASNYTIFNLSIDSQYGNRDFQGVPTQLALFNAGTPNYAAWRRDWQNSIDAKLLCAPIPGAQWNYGTPVAIKQDPAQWVLTGGGTITTGKRGPDGSLMAADCTGRFNCGAAVSMNLNVGDYLVGGIWIRGTGGSGVECGVSAGPDPDNGWETNGENNPAQFYSWDLRGPDTIAADGWHWVCGAAKFTTAGANPVNIVLTANIGNSSNRYFFGPSLVYIPASEAEDDAWMIKMARMLRGGWSSKCPAGSVSILDHQQFWSGKGMAMVDGVTAPSTVAGFAQIYVDTADGDLKVKFGDGTVKTIVVDT